MLIVFGSASCFAQTENTQCINAPISLSADTKEVTVGSTVPNWTPARVYVYYDRRKSHKRPLPPEFGDLTDPKASNPVLLSTTKNVQDVKESYKFTVNTLQDHMMICPDSLATMQANINVEKQSEYTGYYPTAAQKNYKQVSKRVYKRTARKMRKSERKESKVARLSGTTVEVPEKG